MKTLIFLSLIFFNSINSSVESSMNVDIIFGRGTTCYGRGLCNMYGSSEPQLLQAEFFYDGQLNEPIRIEIPEQLILLGNNQNQLNEGVIELWQDIEIEIGSNQNLTIEKDIYNVYLTQSKYIIYL